VASLVLCFALNFAVAIGAIFIAYLIVQRPETDPLLPQETEASLRNTAIIACSEAIASARSGGLAQREFPSAKSKAIPLSGFFAGLIIGEAIWVPGAICFFWLPPVVLSLSLALFVSPLMGLTMRCGACPNCKQRVQIMSAAVFASRCPSCKHELEIRNKCIVDLTYQGEDARLG
jgi:hypothetical protein